MSTKYTVKTNSTIGRYCVSKCNLNAGEVIFFEEPFSYGPKSGCSLICLGCHIPLDEINLCNKCSWPVCNSDCSNENIHCNNECKLFSLSKIKFNTESDPSAQLECITVLRTLLQSERDPKRWAEEVAVMTAHTNERKAKTEYWDAEQINIVNFLHDKCDLGKRFKKETIQFICGILEVNCFEIVTKDYCTIRGLYPNLAILSHNCIANTTHSKMPNSNYKMILRTTVPVNEGSELFSTYTSSTDPTLLRRTKLLDNKYFHCQCQRCSDPTELNTHLNTVKCTKCDNGLVITTNPLDNNAHWKCTHCDYAINGTGVYKVYNVVQNELEELQKIPFGPEKLENAEKLLKQYKCFLHPRHAFKVALWHELAQLYGRADGYTLELLPDILLEHKIEICNNLLQTYNVIEPGLTRLRGIILYELHVALLLLNRSHYENKLLTLEKFKEEMRKVADILEEAGKILSLEPEGSEESLVAAIALRSLDTLRKSIEEVKEREPEEGK